jgi:transposase
MLDRSPHCPILVQLTRTDPDPRVRHRADAVLLVADGHSVSAAARAMHTSAGRVRAWRDRFLVEGRAGLVDRPRAGRPPKLGDAARELLERVLPQSPLEHGYPVTIWTVADLTDLLGRHGYRVCCATVTRTLHALGYRCRRPRHDLTPPPGCRRCCLRQACLGGTAQKGALAGAGFRLVSVDEGDLHPHPHLAKTWQRRGHPMSVPAAGADQRRAVFGALDDASGQLSWRLREHKNGDGFAAFLAQLAQTWPDDDLLLVLANVSSHRSPAVRTWGAAQAGRIIPCWLPASTPNLNLIERVWRLLKHGLACHRFWADVAGLETAAATLLDQTEARFHTNQPPSLRLVQNFGQSA